MIIQNNSYCTMCTDDMAKDFRDCEKLCSQYNSDVSEQEAYKLFMGTIKKMNDSEEYFSLSPLNVVSYMMLHKEDYITYDFDEGDTAILENALKVFFTNNKNYTIPEKNKIVNLQTKKWSEYLSNNFPKFSDYLRVKRVMRKRRVIRKRPIPTTV